MVWKRKNNYNIITYGTQQGSKVLGQNAVFHENGSTCEAVIDSKHIMFIFQLEENTLYQIVYVL